MRVFTEGEGGAAFYYPQSIIYPLTRKNDLLLMVTGTVQVDITSQERGGWHNETLRLVPSFASAFGYAGQNINDPAVTFQVEQYTTYASLATIYNKGSSVNSGFGIDAFRPYFSQGDRGLTNGSGIEVDIAVQDIDAEILRISYQLTVIGQFVTNPNPAASPIM